MSDIKITIKEKKQVPVKFLHAQCRVRFWEDARVNGVEDVLGDHIPCRDGDDWCPLIDLKTGKIQEWPEGTVADIHYKVCDEGVYTLLNKNAETVVSVDGYVINMMCPNVDGFGDYVIMKIGPDGVIEDWKIDLTEFEEKDCG